MKLYIILHLVSFFILINNIYCKQQIGDNCIILPSGDLGICIRENQCPNVHNETKLQKCDNDVNTINLVCCPTVLQQIHHHNKLIKRSPYGAVGNSGRAPGEISRQKCIEYGKYIYKKSKPVILLPNAPDAIKKECGFTVVELVVGGTAAKPKEFPHMARIGFESTSGITKWGCGGSIISEQYILTAAHCLESHEYGLAKFVKIGMTKMTEHAHSQTIKVAQRIKHPNYTPPSRYNDIGLLKLEKSAHLSPNARPACLYQRAGISATRAIATGWGRTELEESSNVLQRVVLELTNNQRCNNYFQRETEKLAFGIVSDTQICAGASDEDEEEKDTCQGDSGGPLQIYHIENDVTCMYDIIGITSFGKTQCELGKIPGVYTRVSPYIKWIEDTVWP